MTKLAIAVFLFAKYLPEDGRQMPKHVAVLTYDCMLLYATEVQLRKTYCSLDCTEKFLAPIVACGPGSSVGIVTGYGLDGPGSNSGGGRDFPHLSRPALGPTQPPVQLAQSFPGVKSGRGVTLTPHPLLVPWSWKGRAIPLLPL